MSLGGDENGLGLLPRLSLFETSDAKQNGGQRAAQRVQFPSLGVEACVVEFLFGKREHRTVSSATSALCHWSSRENRCRMVKKSSVFEAYGNDLRNHT